MRMGGRRFGRRGGSEMNLIKYLNPSSGEVKRIRIQPLYIDYSALHWKVKLKLLRRPSMPEADEQMAKKGFVRCGLRFGSRAAVRQSRKAS